MPSIAPLIAAWDEGHREYGIALVDFPDSELWTRPHPRLLSVGELTGHVAYWQAVWTVGAGERPDLSAFPVQSPLLDHAFRYYTSTVDEPFRVDLTTADAFADLMRIHETARASCEAKDIDDSFPGQWGTWGNFVQYQAFHVAYHTGQVYSVRHILGHSTEDN